MGSIASASVANRALSETSKKGMATDSPEVDYLGYDADLSADLRNVEMVKLTQNSYWCMLNLYIILQRTREYTTSDMDESSYESSFFESFLKTDGSSDEQTDDDVSFFLTI